MKKQDLRALISAGKTYAEIRKKYPNISKRQFAAYLAAETRRKRAKERAAIPLTGTAVKSRATKPAAEAKLREAVHEAAAEIFNEEIVRLRAIISANLEDLLVAPPQISKVRDLTATLMEALNG